jgi:hypothetical protein
VTDAAPQRRRSLPLDLAGVRALSRLALPWALSALGFAVAYLVVTWPLVTRVGHATWGGPGDGWALIWQTRVRFEHGISYLSPTYTPDVAWPLGTSVASALLLSNAVLELPHLLLLALGVDDVSAYNAMTFLVTIASSLVMAVVVRRLGCRRSVAFWAGLAYLLAPWHLEKVAVHPTLASMACLPLLLLGIIEWTRAPSVRTGALVVGASLLSVYSHAYYGIAAGLLLLSALPILLIVAWRQQRLGTTVIRTTVLGGILALVPLPLAAVLARQSSLVTAHSEHPLYINSLALRPHLLFLPSSDNAVLGGLSREYLGRRGFVINEGELALYVGMLTIALAVIAVVAAVRDRIPRIPVAVAGVSVVVGVVFAAPARAELPLLGAAKLPAFYLNEVFGFVSAPARFFALTLTGMVLLAALGLEHLARRVPRRSVAILVAGACIVSAVELPFHRDDMIRDTGPTQLVRAMQETIPAGEPVAQYPSITTSLRPIADQLFYQLQHRHPVLNGGMPGTPGESLRGLVSDHLDPRTPGRLARLGYRWLTYDQPQAIKAQELVGSLYPPGETPPLPRGYRVVRRLPDGSTIMRVVAAPAPLHIATLHGFHPDGWLGANGSLLACADRPGLYVARFQVRSLARERRVRIGGDELTVPAGGPFRAGATLHLRRGCQVVWIEILGPPPDRPSDVIEGNTDQRKLSIGLSPERLDALEAKHRR